MRSVASIRKIALRVTGGVLDAAVVRQPPIALFDQFAGRDALYPVEIFVEQYRAIPNASLWIMPNAGHHSIYMEQKEAFASAAITFLRA